MVLRLSEIDQGGRISKSCQMSEDQGKGRTNKGKLFVNMFPGKISNINRTKIIKVFIIHYEIVSSRNQAGKYL